MTTSDALLLDRMKAAIGSPYHWENRDWVYRRALYLYWREVASRHELDGEMQFYAQSMGLFCLSDGVVAKLELNQPRWRPQAIAEFERRTFLLRNFRHLSKSEHDKHWLPDTVPEEKLIASTVNHPAKYFPRCSLEFLQAELAHIIRLNWHAIAEKGADALFADFEMPVGAANGIVTRFARFYLNRDNGEVHSRPIREGDKPAGALWTSQIEANFGPDVWPCFHDLSHVAVIDEEPVFEIDEPDDGEFERPRGGPKGLFEFQTEFGPEAVCHQIYSPSVSAFTTQLMIPFRPATSKEESLEHAWAVLQKLVMWLIDQEQPFLSNERFILIIHWDYAADNRLSHIFAVGGTRTDLRMIAGATSRQEAEHAMGYSFIAPGTEANIFRNVAFIRKSRS